MPRQARAVCADRITTAQPQPLELHPDFFFPTKEPRLLANRRDPNNPVNMADAVVELAHIPFVRLRDGLPRPLLDGSWSYTEAVERAQKAVAAPELVIDCDSQFVSCHGIRFRLSHAVHALRGRGAIIPARFA